MADIETTSNFTYIGHGFYLVRTQAGLKQAAKHYMQEPYSEFKNRWIDPFPTVYPSIVVFSIYYNGTLNLTQSWIHVNRMADALALDPTVKKKWWQIWKLNS